MESLEDLQSQLSGLRDLRDIVKTMKALSAASIRQYERAVEALANYYRTVELGLHVAVREAGTAAVAELTGGREPSGAGLIWLGSDHGLCGRFNEDIVNHAVDHVQELGVPTTRCRVLAVGARAAGGLERADFTVEEDLMVPGAAARITDTVQQLLLKIDEWQEEAGIRRVLLFYNRSRQQNTSYESVSLELLPIDLRRFRRLEQQPWPSRNVPGFTLPRTELLRHLLRQYFFVTISRACAESQAAEHGSRLAAMQAAEKNLADRLDEVTMSYRRARQTVITSELLDVVSGFEAITRSD